LREKHANLTKELRHNISKFNKKTSTSITFGLCYLFPNSLPVRGGSGPLYKKQLKQNLFLLHVKVVDDDSNEEVECEERPKDDEEDEIQVHVDAYLMLRLLAGLHAANTYMSTRQHLVYDDESNTKHFDTLIS